MSLVSHRSVTELALRARSGVPRGLVTGTIGFGLLVAAAAGASTASTLQARAATLAVTDHRVTATVSPAHKPVMGRLGIGPAVAEWVYPSGVRHVEQIDVPVASLPRSEQLWVDSAGRRTAGPPDTLAIVGGAAWAILRTLLLTALVLAAAAGAVLTWQRRRLRSAVDARWGNLVHQLWEDL